MGRSGRSPRQAKHLNQCTPWSKDTLPLSNAMSDTQGKYMIHPPPRHLSSAGIPKALSEQGCTLPRTPPKPPMAFDVPGSLWIPDDVPLRWEAPWENPHKMVVEVEERMESHPHVVSLLPIISSRSSPNMCFIPFILWSVVHS